MEETRSQPARRTAGNALRGREATRVCGVVVDVPVRAGFDTLAAYEDRTARYLNAAGGVVSWEAPDTRMDDHIRQLLSAGQDLVAMIGPWPDPRPPLVPPQGRISLLTPSGLHFGQAPFDALARDAMAAPVIGAAAALMQALVQATESS